MKIIKISSRKIKKSCHFERNQVSKKFTILQKSKHISRAQQQHKAAKL